MLNMMIANCEGMLIEQQWDTVREFLEDMNSDRIDLPMHDDEVCTMTTDADDFGEEALRDMGIYKVADVVEWAEGGTHGQVG